MNANDCLSLTIADDDQTNLLQDDLTDEVGPEDLPEPEAPKSLSDMELATQMMAKLCHDFISPTGAIVSGVDLLEDPTAVDMRDDAVDLIKTSSKKLACLIAFARVAFGASNTSESFSAKQIRSILDDSFSTMRGQLTLEIEDEQILSKTVARIVLNLGYLAGQALPTGGQARIWTEIKDDQFCINSTSQGPRARLKAEAIEGLKGMELSDGLAGQWIQPYWLHRLVKEAEGEVAVACEDSDVRISIVLPNAAQPTET